MTRADIISFAGFITIVLCASPLFWLAVIAVFGKTRSCCG
jgi:hypothetical protein